MKNIILFDKESREALLPLTFTRPMGELRIGILTIKEKWEKCLNGKVSYITQHYLAEKYPIDVEDENYVIDGSIIPSPELAKLVLQLNFNEALMDGDDFIAAKVTKEQIIHLMNNEAIDALEGTDVGNTPFLKINHTWDLFRLNATAIQLDFVLLTKGRKSAPISSSNTLINKHQIFVEPGATIECSVLNAENGPIYIGENATIMEGCLIRGGFSLGANSTLKMGTRIYGPTTIGPYSKMGGEIKNSVILGYSNKVHDGYFGNSIMGEWCNLGANTNISNMKNNYSNVRVWNYNEEKLKDSGQQFCGVVIGDHAKFGISTILNTGTIVGIFANIFGTDFPDKFLPSFTWGGVESSDTYRLEKAFEVAEKVYKRRQKDFNEVEKNIIRTIFEQTEKYRTWEPKMHKKMVDGKIAFVK
jgi:UDP-N-acetylglucosamine diphosphorylase/glucosamine-1-phosphate N-acetyltransferase